MRVPGFLRAKITEFYENLYMREQGHEASVVSDMPSSLKVHLATTLNAVRPP